LAVPEPRTVVLVVGGPIGRADVLGLSDCARAVLEESDVELLVCDLDGLVEPDAAAVDALARLQLTARRHGVPVLLHRPSPTLVELLSFAGLNAVLARRLPLRLKPWGEPEEREQELGVQEEGEPDDPAA
jgi:ABC-type transporter Mla MlaB component